MSDDVTANAQQLEELEVLRHRVELLSATLNSLPLEIYVKDTESRFTFVNSAAQRSLGVDDETAYIGKTDFDLMTQQEAGKRFADEQDVMRTGQPILNQEQCISNLEGQTCWRTTSKTPLCDSKGDIVGIVEIGQDISDRKQVEEALTRERNLMRSMIDSMADTIYATDSEGRYLLANLTFLRRRGLSKQEELIGRTVYDFLEASLAADFFAEDVAVMSTGRPVINREIQLASRPDKPWRSYTKVPWRDERGEVAGLVVHSRDISEIKRMEGERIALAIEREKMKILATFIEDVSHEFRTPLSAINVKAYRLGKANSPEVQAHLLASLEEQSTYIGELVDAMLMMARLDSSTEFALGDLDWAALLSEIENSCRSLAEKKQVTLSIASAVDLPGALGDDEKLRTALSNLVRNAIQYTPAGGSVELRAYPQGGFVVFDVTDTGIGISEDDQVHIFDRFYRVDKARTERGAGLGLSIARKIVEAHGGRVEVESVLSQGSTFRVWLPISASHSMRSVPESSDQESG